MANEREEKIRKILERKGLTVLQRGWPDFLVVDESNETSFALEVKTEKDKLSKDQEAMHSWLLKMGLPVYVTRGDENLNRRGRRMLSKEAYSQCVDELDTIKRRIEHYAEDIGEDILRLAEQLEACSIILNDSGTDQRIKSADYVFESPMKIMGDLMERFGKHAKSYTR